MTCLHSVYGSGNKVVGCKTGNTGGETISRKNNGFNLGHFPHYCIESCEWVITLRINTSLPQSTAIGLIS